MSNINRNLQNTNKNIKSIVDNINKINIDKAAALERNIKLLSEAKSQEKLREAIEQLRILIGLLVEAQEKQISTTEKLTDTVAKANGLTTEENKKADEKDRKEIEKMDNNSIMQEILGIFRAITRTGGQTAVNVAGEFGNNIDYNQLEKSIAEGILDASDGTADGKFTGR